MQNLAQDIRWDLSDLYASAEDPQINQDLNQALSKSKSFEKEFSPYFQNHALAGQLPLHDLLEEYKGIITLMTRPAVYSQLLFAVRTHEPKIAAFMQKVREELTRVQNHLVFFDVGWNRLDETVVQKLIADPQVQAERHFLEKIRIYAPHTLAEGEEKIMSLKSNTSGHAFSRLFDEVMNNIPFYVEEAGKKTKKTESDVLALLHSRDREERRKASSSLAEGLQGETHLLTYIYNMILADHRTGMQIRHYGHPMDPMNLSNEIERNDVLNLVQSVKKAYPLAMRYYRLKRKLLGLEKLYDYDRYAPVDTNESLLSFEDCRRIVLEGYYGFSDQTGKIAEQFFEKRWIDAEVREGKRGGGFCCQTLPDLHPYILVNYTGSLRDVMTVAHELGHGLHQYLAGRRVGILESDAPLTLAETASVFGEMIIFEKIMSQKKDPAKRLALLCGKIDDQIATVFRQIVMTDFELKAHEAGLKDGELGSEQLSDFWIQANAELYGDSVELTEAYRHGWKYIPHFIHSPFYCYAYAFAQLFVLTLYEEYKKNPQAFLPRYLEMLSLGGSRKPGEIAAIAGLNIHDPNFWQSGLQLLEDMISEAEKLAASNLK